MSKLKPGSDEYNRATNRIADINLTIDTFLDKFDSFRQDYNITDKNLNEKLQLIIDVIDSFLDNEPHELGSHEKTKINFNIEEHTIRSVYVCDACNEEIGSRYKDIQRHILNAHMKKLPKNTIENIGKNNVLQSIPLAKAPNKENNLLGVSMVTAKGNQKTNEKQLTRDEKRKLKKELGKKDKATRSDGRELENLPKRAKSFIAGDFSKFLIKAAEEGNKLKFIPAYEEIEKSLIKAINPVYPDAKIHFFGSRASGLGTIHSDLDMFLDIGNVYDLYGEQPSKIVTKLTKVYDILSKNPMEWTQLVKVKTARVPVLKVINKKQLIDCDIAFSHGLGPCNTKLMRYFFELQPLCHKMCIFIKQWIIFTNLKTHFTTYTLTLMVVFYLQTKSILPPIKDLQEEIAEPFMIGPWQGNFIEKRLRDLHIQKHDDSFTTVRTFLREFFEFYTNFDFATNVICPYLGTTIKKENFNTVKNPMIRYFNYYQQNRDQNSFQIDKVMCVQDPLEQNHNVAKAITDGLLKRLRHYFSLSSKDLK